jgi:two-component sensor histidine kinase
VAPTAPSRTPSVEASRSVPAAVAGTTRALWNVSFSMTAVLAGLILRGDRFGTRRGRAALDAWCAGLIGFVLLLLVEGGPSFALLLFLVTPFIAVVHDGRRRVVWLAASLASCATASVLLRLPVGATAMRLSLVLAAAAVALALAQALRAEAARADLARTLTAEAHHRIKNDLQTVADLLLLGRNGGSFDETASRIHSIATVHRLLAEGHDRVDAAALLQSIAEHAPVPVAVDADAATFDAATAQKLGIVANELVTNAFQHGAVPIVLRLRRGAVTRLSVDDDGAGVDGADGLGLELVRRVVEQGLDGRFELSARSTGGTHAEVVFPAVTS